VWQKHERGANQGVNQHLDAEQPANDDQGAKQPVKDEKLNLRRKERSQWRSVVLHPN